MRLLERSEVAEKEKWNPRDIFKSDEVWQQKFDKLSEEFCIIEDFVGKLNDKETVKKCLDIYFELDRKMSKLYVYAHMNNDVDGANEFYKIMEDKARALATKIGVACAFVVPELSSQTEYFLTELKQDEEFEEYNYFLKRIIDNKKHILSAPEEKILAAASDAFATFKKVHNAFETLDLKFGKVNINGERTKLSMGMLAVAMQSQNRDERKGAFDELYTKIRGFLNTISENYIGLTKRNNFYAQVKGYKSAMDMSMSADDVPTVVYEKLLSSVRLAQPKMHDYMAFRKKKLGYENLYPYDMHLPLFENVDIKVDFDKAYKIVVDALAPMGQDYVDVIKKAKEDRWIDVRETVNKRTGAYCTHEYETHPYVLLNYQETTHDVFTIAHEMGHAMHSYFSSASQPFAKADYSIFVAEIASTVNEVLLIKHLIKEAKDSKTINYLNQYFIDMFRTTIFRQTQFSEFEKIAHEKTQNGEPLTKEILNEIYFDLNKQYYGDAMTHHKYIANEWARIPHFYSAFYVYKYATGLTSAISLANKILSGETETYFNFLKAGGCKSPYEILKDAGVDLATNEPYTVAMQEFDKALEALKKS